MAEPRGSKLLTYASALYARLDMEATQDAEYRVWRGRIIETCRSIGIPDGTRSKVVNRLRATGSIEQITRGFRGDTLTVYVLHHPPTAERFNEPVDGHLTDAPSLDTLARAVEDLRRQIGGINLLAAFANVEQRLNRIEEALNIK